jgi:hypothetical protein
MMASLPITRAASINDHDNIEQSVESMEIEIQSLPPTDYGRDAYLVLAGYTLIQAPVWGKNRINTYKIFNS